MYALIRSVASIRADIFFLGPEMYQKWPKKGVNFCAFGAKIFGDSDQALIRTHQEGEL